MHNSLPIPLTEYRCTCGKMLFKGVLLSSWVEIKCKRCSSLLVFGVESSFEEIEQYSVLVDEEGKIVEVSPAALTTLSYSREEIVGMPIVEFDKNADQLQLSRDGATILTRKHIKRIGSTNNQRIHLYEIRTQPTILLRDAPSHQELKVHTQTAEVDRIGKYTYISMELSSLLQIDPESLIGKSIFDSLSPPVGALYSQWFSELLPAHCPYSIESVKVGDSLKKITFVPMYSDIALLYGYTVIFE
jgi:phage FluMu protein Com